MRYARQTLLAGIVPFVLIAFAHMAEAGACRPNQARVGAVCMDKYQASIWFITSDKTKLIQKIRKGTVKRSDLQKANATQYQGTGLGNEFCPDTGAFCTNIYAVSIPGVMPSTKLTWFKALQACNNSYSRLPTNAEWQAAVAGTPNPNGDVLTPCDRASSALVPTGTRSGCVSNYGVFDMVGNAMEFVAEWTATGNPGSWSFTSDNNTFQGTDDSGPRAITRGGLAGDVAGPFTIEAWEPLLAYVSPSTGAVGFRCASPARDKVSVTLPNRVTR